jgi:glycine/D-amino acid oxidase-like deaminating enzyme
LPLVQAEASRIFRITVCLRPFRAAGPRLDVETVGEKAVVHNYGHGGSGWSLSWGSSRIAADKALAAGARDIAVIGCGALGLTSAILLQQAGAKVTIYAKERGYETRSARATGTWSPDSRIALASRVDAGFPALWEQMTRYSFARYQSYLGLAGNPVEWTDRYMLADDANGPVFEEGKLDFAHYGVRVRDLTPRGQVLAPGSHPFPTRYASRNTSLTFNVAAYAQQLMTEFLIEGGKFERMEFHSPADLARLPQRTIIHATGYGARDLWKDETVTPVRGQIAWLIPQQDVTYGVIYRNVMMLGRRDGIVVQGFGATDDEGYADANEQPDRAQAEQAVKAVADLYSRMRS